MPMVAATGIMSGQEHVMALGRCRVGGGCLRSMKPGEPGEPGAHWGVDRCGVSGLLPCRFSPARCLIFCG